MKKQLLSFGALALLAVTSCQTNYTKLDHDKVASFWVEVTEVTGGSKPLECKSNSAEWCAGYANCSAAGLEMGFSSECPLEFPIETAPVTVKIYAEALDVDGNVMTDFNGNVLMDTRPGRIVAADPYGTMVEFKKGIAEVSVDINQAYGETRIWIEDCGSWWDQVDDESLAYGTFATGVSDPIYFKGPTLYQMQRTIDNTTSALVPKGADVCAIMSDRRYQVGEDMATASQNFNNDDEEGTSAIQGNFTNDGVEWFNVGPAQMGSFMTVDRGRLVVTALDNAGFFVTDIDPVTQKTDTNEVGFNHLYVFNFNYPEGMVVGSVLKKIQGAPIEFTGTTQLQQPSWEYERDKDGNPVVLSKEEMPAPELLSADTYASSLNTYGRNINDKMHLERLEGALVTMRNLAPASGYYINFSDGTSLRANCDSNNSGGIERANSQANGDVSPTLEELRKNYPQLAEACGIAGNEYNGTTTITVPQNAFEYCCERVCYQDINCSEESAFVSYYQWAASVTGNYEDDGSCDTSSGKCSITPKTGKDKQTGESYSSCPVKKNDGEACFAKIAIISAYAKPEFDPQAFAKEQLAKPANQRKCLQVTGNLRQVLAARPTWVIVLRGPDDLIEHDCE